MKVVWTRRAVRHLVHLREYIKKDSEHNANLVAQRILKGIDLLQLQPGMGDPGKTLGTRQLVIPNTPYIISYRVRRGVLELLAIFHGRQKWPM